MSLPTRQPGRYRAIRCDFKHLKPESEAHERGHDQSPPSAHEVQSGLEGVVAFATEIAEPDRAGGSLRYRGVDIEDLVGTVPTSRSGACWWTAASSPACRPPNPRR